MLELLTGVDNTAVSHIGPGVDGLRSTSRTAHQTVMVASQYSTIFSCLHL
ncbi:hypothetical protein FHX77_000868 [Bifidobacterium commune]|uniref:Uncharacterized protein n=1 Tax=Bifidobacterium commune TaxID=1505727 RepID=A0A1C4H760_9BIFI|nr:hypothetical protein [Bifidobacterium commune]SCC80518.1 hypothetical protein GA0061077_1235 [Bifidobacterium commune]